MSTDQEKQHVRPQKLKFFRVLLSGFSNKLVRTLIKYFMRENLTSVTLLSPLCKTWNVKISGDSKGLHFVEGWESFAADHGLSFGDFLVFKSVGGRAFHVTIFDKSSSGKRIPTPMAEEESKKDQPQGSACKRKGLPKPVQHKAKEATFFLTAKEATKQVYKRRSHFEITISPKCKYAVNIPAKFVRSNMNDLSSSVHQMLLRETSGRRLWPVKLHYYKHSVGHEGYLLSTGWQDFRIGNDLKNGDVCVFELKKKNEMLIQIRRSCRDGSRRSKSPLQQAVHLIKGATTTLQLKGPPSKLVTGVSKPADRLMQFRSTIVPTNVRMGGYLKEAVLVDPSSRQWPVKIYYHEERRWCRIGQGWAAFCEKNDVEVGDVCIFSFKLYRGSVATFEVEVIK